MTQRWDPTGRAFKPRVRVPTVPADRRREDMPPLPVTETLRGKKLLVVGGTGFLGKVLLGMLFKRFPDVGHVWLMVRGKAGLSPKERFEQEVWPTPCLDPLREGFASPEHALAALYEKLTPIGGDVVEPLVGISPENVALLKKAGIDAVLNVAGVVAFDPPLDEGLQVNCVGIQHLVALCRTLGATSPVPLLHTSTCYVAGRRIGTIFEEDPRIVPFPRADEIDRAHWDPERELVEGLSLAKAERARADDPQLQSAFAERAKKKLRDLHRPTTGEPLRQAVAKERAKHIDDALVDAGMKRAQHWGWVNTYTYTKAIGEQLLAASGVPFTIVRPAIVETSMAFPFEGWNEGINTSAPLVYLALHGHTRYPTREGFVLDVIPVDTVCAGTLLAVAALLRGEADPVYQFGTGDANGLTMYRLTELMSLYKRRYMRSKKRGNPIVNRVAGRFGPHAVSPETYDFFSAPAMAKGVKLLGKALSLFDGTPAQSATRPLKKQLAGAEKQLKNVDFVFQTFMPFISELDYRFRCDATRALYARCVDEDKAKVPFQPEQLDWRWYLNDVHVPGLRKWVFPHLEAKLRKRPRAEDRFAELSSFLDEIAEREGSAPAVQRMTRDQQGKNVIDHVSYRDLRRRAHACAARLADVGVHPGDRIAIVAKNSPEWAIGFFGILAAGASAVLLDPGLDHASLGEKMRQVEADFALLGEGVASPVDAACLDLVEFTDAPPADVKVTPPEVLIAPDDVAVICFTAGTTGREKTVVHTHKNVTAVLASIAPLFSIGRRDSGLSVLPLFHSFELTCGLLLPLLRGARVTYVDDVTADTLADAFQVAGITAMIGVPKVWEDLEKKIEADLAEAGPFSEAAYQAGLLVNRTLGKALGINLGRVLFRPIHDRLGGKIRFLVSTGAPVPKKTADTFRALGIELKQGYGLTEASSLVGIGDQRGITAAPGLEVEIRDAGADGIGEIVARGDHVMRGYLDDEELTARVLGRDGWLRTGDLGRMDKEGRITLVARTEEVITLPSGRRIYPRAVEEALAVVKGVAEACVVGVPEGHGGERVAALVTTTAPEPGVAADAHVKIVERAVAFAARKLDEALRPTLIHARVEPLPRTADQKVRRPAVVAALIAMEASRVASSQAAAVAPTEVLDAAQTVMAARKERLPAPGRGGAAKRDVDAPVDVPPIVADSAKRALGALQMAFYGKGMRVDVVGKQHVPWDRPTIVAANHASHLDMGLVKYALGEYGQDIVALAAKDYFFEGKWRRTYFERFTNLRPLDRGDNPREAMREASQLIEQGRTVLLFPEGTRTTTGEMGTFRPAVAYLALRHGVDVLPVYVEGTHRSMPRGSLVPKNRALRVKIGEPIPAAALKAATDEANLKMSVACGKAATVIQRAVEALRDDRTFLLKDAIDEVMGNGVVAAKPANTMLRDLFADLERRFQKEEVKQATTFYFSLGSGPEGKWTVQVTKEGCRIVNDKLDGKADCVFKSDVSMFQRIVKEHYIPQISEFLDGTVKTNDPELLTTFVQVFNL